MSVCVNHGSAFEARTTLTLDRGAKAAAEAGSSEMGMVGEEGGGGFGRCVDETVGCSMEAVSTIREGNKTEVKEDVSGEIRFSCEFAWGWARDKKKTGE